MQLMTGKKGQTKKMKQACRKKENNVHSKYAHGFVTWLMKLSPSMKRVNVDRLIEVGTMTQDKVCVRDYLEQDVDLTMILHDIPGVNVASMTEESVQVEHMCHATMAASLRLDFTETFYIEETNKLVPEALRKNRFTFERILQTDTYEPRFVKKQVISQRERVADFAAEGSHLGLLDDEDVIIYEPPQSWSVSNAQLCLEAPELQRLKRFLQQKGRSRKSFMTLKENTKVACSRSPFDVIFSSLTIINNSKHTNCGDYKEKEKFGVTTNLQCSRWVSHGMRLSEMSHAQMLHLYSRDVVIRMCDCACLGQSCSSFVAMSHSLAEATFVTLVSSNNSAILQHLSYEMPEFTHRAVVEVIHILEISSYLKSSINGLYSNGSYAWVIRLETLSQEKLFMTSIHVAVEATF